MNQSEVLLLCTWSLTRIRQSGIRRRRMRRRQDSLAVCIHLRFQINSRFFTLNFTLSAEDGLSGVFLFKAFPTAGWWTQTPTAVAISRIDVYVVTRPTRIRLSTTKNVPEDQLDRNCVASLPLEPDWNCVASFLSFLLNTDLPNSVSRAQAPVDNVLNRKNEGDVKVSG